MSIVLTGENVVFENIQKAMTERRKVVKMVLNSVLSEMVSWIKQNHQSLGGWTDRTGNLNNSINYKPAVDDGEKIVGVICAGMEYAIHVEYMPGHWVISGAITEYKEKIMRLISDRIKEVPVNVA